MFISVLLICRHDAHVNLLFNIVLWWQLAINNNNNNIFNIIISFSL